MDKPNFAGNTDTGLLKNVAFITMLADHVGYLFFPGDILWRIIGRIAFPVFVFCLVLGFLYTKNIKKYFLRLFLFSAVSQIPYSVCFFPNGFGSFQLNVGFTLFLGLWAVYGISRKKYFNTAFAAILSLILPVEYGFYGVGLAAVFYVFSSCGKFVLGTMAGIYLLSPFSGLLFESLPFIQGFAVLSLLFILIKTESKIKIPRWLNYGFYPAHLFALAFIKFLTS